MKHLLAAGAATLALAAMPGPAHAAGTLDIGVSMSRAEHQFLVKVTDAMQKEAKALGNVNLQVLDLIIKTADLKPRQLPVSDILAKRKAELLKVIPSWETGEKSGIFAENFFPDHPVDLLKKEYGDLWAKAGKVVKVGEMIPENNLRGRFGGAVHQARRPLLAIGPGVGGG